MQIIPLDPVPAQNFSVLLNQQNVQINLFQKSTGMFIDIYVDSTAIVLGVLCENLNRIVRSLYLGFQGDLSFVDNQGADDPVFAGLGTRFSLAYIPPEELPAGVG